jgi:hypothetical protein
LAGTRAGECAVSQFAVNVLKLPYCPSNFRRAVSVTFWESMLVRM